MMRLLHKKPCNRIGRIDRIDRTVHEQQLLVTACYRKATMEAKLLVHACIFML
jgi:hypothetical protein